MVMIKVMMMVIMLIMEASMLTIKDTDVAESSLTSSAPITALILMIITGLVMTDVSNHLMMISVGLVQVTAE